MSAGDAGSPGTSNPSGEAMQLYYSENLNPRVAVAVARYLDSPVEFVRASPRRPDLEDAFRPINPNTLVPVLVEAGRPNLWEADAIACRLSILAGSDFWPTDERLPEIVRWVSWSAQHFNRAANVFYFEHIVRPQIFTRPANAAALEEADLALRRFAPILDDVLAERRWLVGERLSYADFRVASVLPYAEQAQLPLGQYANIRRWHDRLNLLDGWRAPFEGLDDEAQPQERAAGGSR
jgi:glutathione S-transferase